MTECPLIQREHSQCQHFELAISNVVVLSTARAGNLFFSLLPFSFREKYMNQEN